MKKPETIFKEKVLSDLKALPHTYFVKIQQKTQRGIPDIFICCRGAFIAIELKKSEKESPDDLQDYNLFKINEAQGMALTADPTNWKDTFSKLSKFACYQVVSPEWRELEAIRYRPDLSSYQKEDSIHRARKSR